MPEQENIVAAKVGQMDDPGTRLALLDAAMEQLPIGIAVLEMDGTPVILNSAFRRIHGIPHDMDTLNFSNTIAIGMMDRFSGDPVAFLARLQSALGARRPFIDQVEIGGRIIAIHDSPLDDNYILAAHQDITDQVAAERRIHHLAHHDALTGAPNRAAFSTRLEHAVAEAAAQRARFAVLSVDLDDFKDVNDIFGHGAGDILLCGIVDRFQLAAEGAFLARIGGDEFGFLCETGSQPETAAALADRLLTAVVEEFEIDGQALKAGLSIGVAIYPEDGADATALLAHADAALYRAKNEGRGTARFYETVMDRRIHEQRLLHQDLRKAVAQGELELDYQPQATIDGRITGFEALVRWWHPRRGLVMPGEFIALAEQTGLIVEIGAWILREACSEAARWPHPLHIAVNLSPIQFRHGDLAQLVHETLLDSGLSPGRLELEITESVMIEDFPRAIALLRRIKALGVRIAMDDFGTGYSSLTYLQAFPFDKLKIDRSFIARLGSGHQAEEIVRAVIGLGRGLNLPIVAEGVETADQLAFLSAAGCSGVQGYLIGKPLTIDRYALVTGADPARRSAATMG
jgi:diguanylate cyclase (GGDEF)-like protein